MNEEKQQATEKPVGGGTSYPDNGIETSDWKNLRWLAWIVIALVAVTVVLLVIS